MWYVIGRARLKPGRRDAFLRDTRDFVAASRQDAGCLFFEFAASADSPDMVLVVEHYTDAEAHRAHQRTEHYLAMLPRFEADVLVADFEDIAAATVRHSQLG